MWQRSAMSLSLKYILKFSSIISFIIDYLAYFIQIFLFVLISVAFLTLLERKVLRYTQLRKGPNKLGWIGILQPFSDALKLFSKEDGVPFLSNSFLFWVSPIFGFLVTILIWFSFWSYSGYVDIKISVLFFLCCVSLRVYSIIFSGWSSNSKYALLGSLRSVAQTISYEVVLAFIFLSILRISKTFRFLDLFLFQNLFVLIIVVLPLFIIFFVSCVVETNRAPFDLAEGESELVSGFNVEYGGLKFALIFLSEYARIIWISFLIVGVFIGCRFSLFLEVFLGLLIVFLFLFLRSSYPRIRYDILIMLTWKKFLVLSLTFFFLASFF